MNDRQAQQHPPSSPSCLLPLCPCSFYLASPRCPTFPSHLPSSAPLLPSRPAKEGWGDLTADDGGNQLPDGGGDGGHAKQQREQLRAGWQRTIVRPRRQAVAPDTHQCGRMHGQRPLTMHLCLCNSVSRCHRIAARSIFVAISSLPFFLHANNRTQARNSDHTRAHTSKTTGGREAGRLTASGEGERGSMW